MGNSYLDNLEAELKSEGVKPLTNSALNRVIAPDDYELKTVLEMEQATKMKYSDEQKSILMHHGSACILACAGSGKTTVTTHLIAKRIKTREISDVDKLIYTTYSKAGATEMKERLDSLLKQLGINKNVQVRTLHSFFLQVLRIFGVTADIIDAGERKRYIKEACREAEYSLKDDDLMMIDNLLSYQVNNLLSDKKLIESYVNTLEDLTIEQYSKIRSGYAKRKSEKKLIDYDDMQSYLYLWLVKFAKSKNQSEIDIAKSVRDYCQAMWTDFYIDEAQDVSKLQFEIIRAMVTKPEEPNKLLATLVFIGDDDQCLVEGTPVLTDSGYKKIEEITGVDKVISAIGNGELKATEVCIVPSKLNFGDTYKIKLEHGNIIEGTPEHVMFVRAKEYTDNSDKEYTQILFGSDTKGSNGVYKSIHKLNLETEELTLNSLTNKLSKLKLNSENYARIGKNNGIYKETFLKDIKVGDYIPYYNKWTTELVDEKVIGIELVEGSTMGKRVYDLYVPETLNFIANGIIVHNCIYQWRGSDPSIILSTAPMFDMRTFVLSTNYRCKSAIVDYATTGVKCNNNRYNKGMQSNEDGGDVKICISDKEDLCSLSIIALNHIKWLIAQGNDLKDIAVLSRNNFHLALLSNMLLREGIYSYLTDDMKLTKSYMYKDIRALVDLAQPNWQSELTSQVLWKLCRYMNAATARTIADFQKTSCLTLEDTLGYILKNIMKSGIDFDKKVKVTIQAEDKIKYFMSRLQCDTIEDLIKTYEALSSHNSAECLKTLMYLYTEGSSYLYKSKDKHRSLNGLVKYIRNLLIKDGYDRMVDFLRVTEQFENGRMGIIGSRVTLSTMHSAKGREWKNVIMFACDNVSQPSFDGIYNMLEDGISVHDIFENLDEERRLSYVGNTRAKENLLVLTYKVPSVFILEALGAIKSNNNAKILEFVQDNNKLSEYSEFIEDNILNKDSKYYYDIEKYKQ